MFIPAIKDLTALRNAPFDASIAIKGVDFTDASSVRFALFSNPDDAAPVLALDGAATSAPGQGMSYSVATVAGVPTTTFFIRLNKTTVDAQDSWPANGLSPGEVRTINYHFMVTKAGVLGGRETRWQQGRVLYVPKSGPLTAAGGGGVNDSTLQLAIDGATVIAVQGADALAPLVASAQAARDAVKPLFGNGPPASTLGIEGSIYTDIANPLEKIQYGPKTAAGWGVGQSQKGVPGANTSAIGTRAGATGQVIPPGVAKVQTSGGAVDGDGGGAPYIVGSMDDPTFLTRNPDWGFTDSQQRQWRMREGEARPQMFRRTTDAAGDDTASFQRFRDGMYDMADDYPDQGRGVMHALILDRAYTITQPGAILAQGQTGKRHGLSIRGINRNVGIRYNPTTAGPLIFNDDSMLFFEMNRLKIVGLGLADQASLFESRTIVGAPQDFALHLVRHGGRWGPQLYLLRPDSVNNNSEAKFTRCAIAPATPSTFLRSQGSDQHLNYWFQHCSQQGGGPLVDMQKGGHVTVRDHDASGVLFPADDYYIKLGAAPGDQHSLGVCQATIDTCRFEQKNAMTKFLRMRWPYGSTTIKGYDGSSQVFPNPVIFDIPDNILIELGGTAGAIVSVTDSLIPGHARVTTGEGWHQDTRTKFERNTFFQASTPDEYLAIDAPYNGCRPSVEFTDDNRGSGVAGQNASGTSAWWGGNMGASGGLKNTGTLTAPVIVPTVNGGRSPRKTYTVPLVDANGGSGPTGTSQSAIIPKGALITRVWAYMEPGNGGGALRIITVKLGDGTVVTTQTIAAENAGISFDVPIAPMIWCGTDARRTVTAAMTGNTDRYVPLVVYFDYKA